MAIVLALLTSVFYGFADFTSGHLTKRVSAFAVVGGASIVAGIVSGTLFFIGNVLYLNASSQGSMRVIGAVATLLVLVPLIWDIRHGNVPDPIAIVGVGVIVTLSGIILLGAPEMKGKSSASGRRSAYSLLHRSVPRRQRRRHH